MSEPISFKRVEAEMAGTRPARLKLVLASPTYGPVDPRHSKQLRVAVMHAAGAGHTWVGDVSPDRMLIVGARNAAAEAALQTDADGIVWVDSDMLIPTEGITRLVGYGKDFTSGVYFQRIAPHWPLVMNYDAELDRFRFAVKWPTEVLFPADGVGFGFCYTSTKLLRQMYQELPEVKDKGWFADGKYSEDLSFCRRAGLLGYQVYVDTGLLLGHQGDPKAVTIDDFKAYNPYQEGTGNPLVPIADGAP